ncbi:band 4.1-like protein 3 isoform X2 [Nematostella vectensis]|uniref:band 4.1-like protein 3 isoform X2 n=1 Tax=Nematostella vectensis TaxID=45351 RepID=UPI00207786A6|nr:band 4.1-like protein 3 isoform X2 [Nematostella vectensis]XP_032232117.2 band 4.1-like protein 3 isoform X2 [Nematostella vectensis]
MPAATKEAEKAETSSPEKESPKKKLPRNRLLCRVTLLDKSCFTPENIQKTAKGIDLMVAVAEHLNLDEKEYFGLLYDHKGEKYWLDPQKEIKKQLKGNLPHFELAVKFYEPYPSKLKHDMTRYMMVLQVRDDIICERLPCSFGAQALLGSYVVQSEFGDYDPHEHKGNYLAGLVFSPNQSHELVERIKELHKEHRGLTPEEADTQYLEAARKLTMYGVDAHPARDGNGDEVLVGVSYAGVLVFKDDLRQNKFPWPKVVYLSYKGRDFSVKSRPGELEELTTTMTFKLPTEKAAKRLYKSCVEHHTFFRLSFPDPPPSKTDSLLRMGSKHRYSDKTLFQLRNEGVPIQSAQPRFQRVSSKNWSKGDAPSTTEIIVVADEEAKKRPWTDRYRNGQKDKKLKAGEAPLSEEEMMATMTMEEREEYKKRMAERLGQIKTTTTTTVYYPGKGGEEDVPLEHVPVQASGAGVEDSSTVAYGVGEAGSKVKVTRLESTEEDREKRRREKEEEERLKRAEEEKRREEKRREEELKRERKEQERREKERQRLEKEKKEAAERAVYAARQPPTEKIGFKSSTTTPSKGEAEVLEFSFATPVSSGETIKRAQMKSADTDSYKGRVVRVDDAKLETPDRTRIAPEVASRTLTWSSERLMNEPYARGHSSTLPARTKDKKPSPSQPEEDRRHSADDLDHDDDDDDHRRRHTSSGGVPLITREELVRTYSPAGSAEGKDNRASAPPEVRYTLKGDTDHEQGETGFVRENIQRYSTSKEVESIPGVTTKTVTITADKDPQVYPKKAPPVVKTKPYSNTASKQVTEHVTTSTSSQIQAAPHQQHPGGHQEGGVVVTRTVTIDGENRMVPVTSETVRHTAMPTEIITKTITIEGDGGPLTAAELKEIMAQQATATTSEVITTSYTTTTRTQTVEKTLDETINLVDEDGNVIATGDPDTDAAIAEAIRQAREADPNVKVTEVVITRNDESSI